MTVPAADTTILVPIRYPLTAESTRTLQRAAQLADDSDDAYLLALHVNLFQYDTNSTAQEIRRAVWSVVGDHPVAVSIRQGFLVEEVIREEAVDRQADVIVIGKNQKSPWRRLLSRIAGNHPAIAPYLQNHTDAEIEIVE